MILIINSIYSNDDSNHCRIIVIIGKYTNKSQVKRHVYTTKQDFPSTNYRDWIGALHAYWIVKHLMSVNHQRTTFS